MGSRSSSGRHDAIGHAIEGLARWLGSPVLLEDAQFRLVAYSSHSDPAAVDEARRKTVLEKRAPQTVLSAMRRHGILHQLRSTNAPIRTPALPEVNLRERVVVPLLEGRRVYGYLWLEECKRKLTSPELQHISTFLAENILPHLIQAHRDPSNHHEPASHLLQQLLHNVTPDLEVETRILNEHLPLSTGQFHVLVARGGNLPANVVEWEGVSHGSGIRAGIGHIVTWLDGVVYILCSPLQNNSNDLIATEQSDCKNFCPAKCCAPLTSFFDNVRIKLTSRIRNVGLGVSSPFTDLRQTPGAASTAANAAFIAANVFGGKRVVSAEQFPFMTSSVSSLIDKREGTLGNGPPAAWIQHVLDYDRQHSTELLHTLEQYLDQGRSASEAAFLLHVHPNTLLYRLRRIQELTQIDLRNGIERTLVHIELKMWKASQQSERQTHDPASCRVETSDRATTSSPVRGRGGNLQ